MSNSVFWENKKNITILSSAELAQRVIKVKTLESHTLLALNFEQINTVF